MGCNMEEFINVLENKLNENIKAENINKINIENVSDEIANNLENILENSKSTD